MHGEQFSHALRREKTEWIRHCVCEPGYWSQCPYKSPTETVSVICECLKTETLSFCKYFRLLHPVGLFRRPQIENSTSVSAEPRDEKSSLSRRVPRRSWLFRMDRGRFP